MVESFHSDASTFRQMTLTLFGTVVFSDNPFYKINPNKWKHLRAELAFTLDGVIV